MEHVGIDLGSSRSAICVLSADGAIVKEHVVATAELEGLMAKRPPAKVAVESCSESRKIALQAREHGHLVRVVPSVFVRSLGIGARRIKTDKRDARSLAVASFRLGDELPQVHVRSDEASAIQDLVRARASLVGQRTMAINFVRAQLRKALLGRGPRCTATAFVERVRELVGDNPSLQVNGHLKLLHTLNEEIKELEREMQQVAKANEAAQRLQKISGVGAVVALAFIAAIDDAKRFGSAARVASYVGLSPGENTTGFNVKRTSIVAAGQKQLRALLVQAAHVMLIPRGTREPIAQWAIQIQQRSGRKVAVCALARRLAVVMWAMLRDGTRYDPTLTRSRHPTPPPLEDVLAEAVHGTLAQA